jgi:glycyl-tRNA synthetase beta chain
LRNILIEEGIKYDIADAALGNFNDILDTYKKAKALESFKTRELFKRVVYTADRVKRLAKGSVRDQIFEHDLIEDEEKKLHKLYLQINWEVNESIKGEDFEKALAALDKFSDPVEIFFQKVLVMHEDERLKFNRLALLKGIDSVFDLVADFSKIVL